MIVTALVALALAGPNDPFNRSRVRPGTISDHCLYWAEKTAITWKANQAGNPETPLETEFAAFRAAFATWNDPMTTCGNVSFVEGPRTTSRNIGWLKDASEIANNENILVFRQTKCGDVAPLSDSCWDDDNDSDDCGNKFDCWQHQSAAIALTTTTYDPQSGRILDADVELNVPSFIFSTVDAPRCVAPAYSTACVAWDLQNTVTHEIGHMMGLDHTMFAGSTMNPTAPPGETSKRLLDTGTSSFVCFAYPKGQPSKDCVVRPVNPTLGNATSGCACDSGAGLLVLPALLFSRRRRRA